MKYFVIGLCLATGFVAEAQDVIEEVTVVGSRIERQDYNSTSPVYTLSRQSLLEDGSPTLSDFLNKQPQFSPADGKTSNNPGSGLSEVDLRSLGSNRTLVMIDGLRLGPAGSNGVVDLNAIPTSMIHSIEVLTGGASAVYGSDAVSGVVNVQLRRDFEGVEVNTSYDVTAQEDGEIWDVSLLGGTALLDGRAHLTAYYSRTEREEVPTAARGFSNQPLGEDLMGGLVPDGSSATAAGSIPIPALVDGAFAPFGITFDPDGSPRAFDRQSDLYNYYGEFNFLQTGLERDTMGVISRLDLSDATTALFDISYSERSVVSEIAPVPAGSSRSRINVDNPLLTPSAQQVLAMNYDPEGTGFFVGPFRYRAEQLGGRESHDEMADLRLRLGLESESTTGWSWSIDYLYYDFERENEQRNLVSSSRFLQALLVDPQTGQCFDPSGGCIGGNFFGEGNLSAEAADFIRTRNLVNRNDTTQHILQATLSGEITFGQRVIPVVFGAERREEESRWRADPLYAGGDVLGLGSQSVDGDFAVSEVYGETMVPLMDSELGVVELELGIRYSDYDSVGGFTTWKAGMLWQVSDALIFRTMAQRAIRAPNIEELYTPREQSDNLGSVFGFEPDRCSASEDPVVNGLSEVCISQGLAAEQLGTFEANPFYPSINETGGNPELEEEEADTFTIGLTWQPALFESFAVAVDYYSIEIDNAVTDLNREQVLSNCYALKDAASVFCRSVERDQTGNVVFVSSAPYNAAKLSSKGIDFQLDALMPAPGREGWDAQFRFGLVANHLTEYELLFDPSSPVRDCAGYFGWPCDFTTDASIPEQRVNVNLAYQAGPLTVSLNWRWIDGMKNAFLVSGDPFFGSIDLATPETDAEDYLDLSVNWTFSDQLSVRLGVSNVFDTEPPLLGWNSRQNNTNPNIYDVMGRRYLASLSYAW